MVMPFTHFPPGWHTTQILEKKSISDQDAFQLMLFCLGNGCSPHLITEWILTSQNWATAKKGEKLARQIFYEDFIMNNIDSKSHIWFYFDLHQGKWPFLNGQVKNTSNLQIHLF